MPPTTWRRVIDTWASTATGHQPGRGGRAGAGLGRGEAVQRLGQAVGAAPSGLPDGVGPRGGEPRGGLVGDDADGLFDALAGRRRLLAGGVAGRPLGGLGSAAGLVPAPQAQPRGAAGAARVAAPGAFGGLARGGGADGFGEAVGELLAGLLAESDPAGRHVGGAQAVGGGVEVGADAAGGGAALGGELAEAVAEFADAVAGEGGEGEDGGTGFAVLAEGDAVLVEEAAQVVEDLVGGVLREPVDLVEDDEGDLGVPGHRAQVPLVEEGVAVLLRVDDPDHGVHVGEDAVDLGAVLGGGRVVVGQVDEDQAVEGAGPVGALDGLAGAGGRGSPGGPGVRRRRRSSCRRGRRRWWGGGHRCRRWSLRRGC